MSIPLVISTVMTHEALRGGKNVGCFFMIVLLARINSLPISITTRWLDDYISAIHRLT